MLQNPQIALRDLLEKPENEVVEFKLAWKDYDSDSLYKYISALANEANLKGKDASFMILGVEPKNHTVSGTEYRDDSEIRLQSIKHQVYQACKHSVNVFEIVQDWKRVILFEIPPALRGKPVDANWHYWAREGESLVALSDVKRDEIRNQIVSYDITEEIIKDATINDLDLLAIRKARENFKTKHPKIPTEEIEKWSDEEFLNRAKITKNGKITRTGLILLWKPESTYLLSPTVARITWVLKDAYGIEKDYFHFEPPFLLSVDEVFWKIRNSRYRYLQEWTLFPEEVDMYDSWVFRELLHNCIAHQDYKKASRITLVEYEDWKLVFENAGTFMPGSIESLIESKSPPKMYRNPYLANAMVEINMIDTIGSGVKRVFQRQRDRFFPMPTYTFENENVQVELFGKILDLKYANLLAKNSNLTLVEIIALDKIQKGKAKELDKNGVFLLKKKWLVEWRFPNVYVSAEIAKVVWKPDDYIINSPMRDDFYCEKILERIKLGKRDGVSKDEIRLLVIDMLPKMLSDKQKDHKISNLIQELRRDRKIQSLWKGRYAKWIIN